MSDRYQFEFNVLLFKGDHSWIAQGLEYNIAAQGDTREKAQNRIFRVIVGEILMDMKQEKEPLLSIPQASKEVWDKLKSAKALPERSPLYVPPIRNTHINVTANTYALAGA
jgi:hypothetical protein